MGEANQSRNRSREMHNLSLQIEKYPRDLLQRFMSNTQQQEKTPTEEEEEDKEEIELNLGLSLGGRFGVDKYDKKLYRSSSIAGSIPIFRELDMTRTPTIPTTTTTNTNSTATSSSQAVTYRPIIRTSSLPTETEEEWRKRKELQTLRRLEAKRRRSEKQRNNSTTTTSTAGANTSNNIPKLEPNLEEEKGPPPFGMQNWAAVARQALLQGLVVQPSSQGSVESQGGGSSSGMSELESKPLQGLSNSGEARSPANTQTLQESSNQENVGSSATKTDENTCKTLKPKTESPSKKLDSTNTKGRDIGMSTHEDMPCVFTKGDGPNGRRIEGILYKYGKGEEVRIMCVCHGIFLSPAEFVKHAGGGDVDHPLRQIVIKPSTPFA